MEQEMETKIVEYFKSYGLKIQCDLSDVYMNFYIDFIGIQDYSQIFQEFVEKGK